MRVEYCDLRRLLSSFWCRALTRCVDPTAYHVPDFPDAPSLLDWKGLFRDCVFLRAVEPSMRRDVISSPLEESSHDDVKQMIEQTLVDDDSFWSSLGSADPTTSEFLTFQLASPVTLISAIELNVYRCTYQRGFPVYGPRFVQISIGFSANSFHFQTPLIAMQNTSDPVLVQFAPRLVYGSVIRIELFGRYLAHEVL
jgi:hypothetical protein